MTAPVDPVFLVGFMGVGKTSVGKALATLLDWAFIDLDEMIERAERHTITQIFRESGEARFRQLEARALASLRGRCRMVVACGGGTYAQRENRALIDGMGRAVWLQAPLAEALARCAGNPGRPLLRSEAEAERLYRAREPSYRLAPLRCPVGGLDPGQAAERVAALLARPQ
jgi:shikimate kinase